LQFDTQNYCDQLYPGCVNAIDIEDVYLIFMHHFPVLSSFMTYHRVCN